MRVVRGLKKIVVVVGLALVAAPLPVLADGVTDQAKGLIEQGKGAEAYRMLDILESERAGDPVYDLLLGISALDAGQGTRAIFALERVLAVEPNNVRARAEIARAYMLVGETEAARAEFETTKKQGVPPEVAATIDKLVVAIDRMADASRTSIKGYIEGIIGHDSNANAAPSRSTVAVPVLGGLPFTLDSDSRTRSDWFGTLGGGISIRHPVSPGVVLLGGSQAPIAGTSTIPTSTRPASTPTGASCSTRGATSIPSPPKVPPSSSMTKTFGGPTVSPACGSTISTRATS